MWANAQGDGRPAEYRWCPLFNAAKSHRQRHLTICLMKFAVGKRNITIRYILCLVVLYEYDHPSGLYAARED